PAVRPERRGEGYLRQGNAVDRYVLAQGFLPGSRSHRPGVQIERATPSRMVRRRRRDVGPATRSAQTLKLPHAAAPQKTPRGGAAKKRGGHRPVGGTICGPSKPQHLVSP